MIVRQALANGRRLLEEYEIEDAPLEAEILLRDVLKKTRVELYLELDHELSPQQYYAYRILVRRRCRDEPTAYILGRREFYGRDFLVDNRVLVPRPETELLVEKAIGLARDYETPLLADVGTGCGAVAIILALELPESIVYATDVSGDAIRVARKNCQKYEVGLRVHLLRGDLLEILPQSVDIIVANLPYGCNADLPSTGPVSAEPRLAIDGGVDGLEQIRQLCRQAGSKLRPHGHLLLEVGLGQAEAVAILLHGLFPEAQTEIIPDLSGIDRVVSLSLF
ncbi:MAG: peptide chain release factor N(5)-glutamine methyltransferase [Dehalococcoidales bacterium]|nr:MAG: peptide chain release factor N(5)-glutamine methyltransferase [Dehalococcoidales bacterium]